MTQKSLARLVFGPLFLLAAGSAAGQTCPAPMASMFPPAPGAFTYTAVADGAWNLAATWGGSVPGNGDIVCIPAGRSVTLTSQETSRLRFVQVDGELHVSASNNTRLYIDTLLVDSGGTFKIGTAGFPVQTSLTSELVFISWNGSVIDRTWDPEEKSRGLISMGVVKAFGDAKTHMVPMTADARKGATHLTLDSAPSNWKVGDKIVLTGSYFREVTPVASTSQDEQVTITAISGSGVDVSPALVCDHVRPRSDLRLHVANLTRNVVFRSESPTPISSRGHVMLMTGTDDLENVALVDLGRTDKTHPLDDVVVQCYQGTSLTTCDGSGTDYSVTPAATSAVTNRRGRYALHFHLNGTNPGAASPAKVYGTVVNGTVGWGFVSHSSQVDFINDVAYNFAGAGFVTEAGDELGTFDHDIAIRGTGDGEYLPDRIVVGNADRPQPLADFAFTGDGFWFQGPALQVTNNVAAGCNGMGMIWFTTGQPDIKNLFTDTSGKSHDRYTSFPRSAVSTVYAGFPDLSTFVPRYWDSSVTNEKLVIKDLPILQCDGFEGYGNLVGFRLRFNNAGNTSWYSEYFYDAHIVSGVTPVLMRQAIKNLTLWDNEYGLYPNYTSKTDFSNVTLVNRLDYDARDPYVGATINRQLDDSTFNNLTIDGYEVAGLIESKNSSNTFNNRSEITFTGAQSYLDFANFDTWNKTVTCPVPSGLTVTGSGTSRTIAWTADPAHKRYLVRYRANGDQQWQLVDTTGTSVSLSGLATGTTYSYQVMAGCKDSGGTETAPSLYTVQSSFST